MKKIFKQINFYLRKIRKNRVSNFSAQKAKEKSSDTEVSELFFMVTRTGILPMNGFSLIFVGRDIIVLTTINS